MIVVLFAAVYQRAAKYEPRMVAAFYTINFNSAVRFSSCGFCFKMI